MGYYTRYKLEVKGETSENHYEGVAKISGYDVDWLWEDECKWYDHEENMLEYSKNHPHLVFILSGEGEESGDVWKSVYKDGSSETFNAKLVFEPEPDSLLGHYL